MEGLVIRIGIRMAGIFIMAAAAAQYPGTAWAGPPVLQAPAVNVDYGYDALGRVVSETYYTGTGASKVIIKTITYTYDNAGNITANTVTCGSGGC